MKVTYELTSKEIECLNKIKSFQNSFNRSSQYDSFSGEFKTEINSFLDNDFLDTDYDRYYITYFLTDRVLKYINQNPEMITNEK